MPSELFGIKTFRVLHCKIRSSAISWTAKTKPNLVYALDLRAGEQINLSLSADAGTDFDLDLFDSSATTVDSSIGLVASSETPNSSNEAISYTVTKTGTYYIDVFAYCRLR